MSGRRGDNGTAGLAGAIAIVLVLLVSHVPSAKAVEAAAGRNADSIPLHGVLELSLLAGTDGGNPFADVALNAVFTSPSGVERFVGGFFYGNGVWKVRFAPDETGTWTYSYVLSGAGGARSQGAGSFDCVPSDDAGPVRRHSANPFRWVLANGEAYFPIGIQDCVTAKGGVLAPMPIDGGEPPVPARRVSWDEYLRIYADAGFNLFRFSQRNCSYSLFDDLDHYRLDEALATDELLALARKHGFRVMFGFFGFYDRGQRPGGIAAWLWSLVGWLGDSSNMPLSVQDRPTYFKQKRFIDYCVARWGVYVDFWELLNERYADDEWTALMAGRVRAVDPARGPVATSYEKPFVAEIDVNAPHWYESENELDSDLRVRQLATEWRQAGKPVIVGEQGNAGMNWDPLSARRMRIRTWTALFQEIGFVFWNTSWSKAGMFGGRYTPGVAANIYLGPEERGYIRVLRDFTTRIDAEALMAPVVLSRPNEVRVYGLRSTRMSAAYLHHFENHTTGVGDLRITLDAPDGDDTSGLVADWIEPSTGKLIASVPVTTRRPTLEVPTFDVDLALLVSPRPRRDDAN